MALTVTPYIKVNVLGDGKVTSLEKQLSWTAGTKLEQTFTLKSTDTAVSIDLSTIDTLKYIVLYSASPFQVVMEVNSEIATLSINDIFVYAPIAADTVSSIAISTPASNDINIEVRIYGAGV